MRGRESRVRAWVRRNRWGLVGLPVAAVLVVAGNGSRLRDYYWNADLHHRVADGRQGQWVHLTDTFQDAAGPGVRALDLRITGVEQVTSYTDRWGKTTTIANPAYDAWRVELDGRADPDSVLTGCHLALTEADGTRYQWDQAADGIRQDLLYPCLPADHYGPSVSVAQGRDRELESGASDAEARPATWSVGPVIFVPKGVRITGVMLWWQSPRYATVSVRPEAGGS